MFCIETLFTRQQTMQRTRKRKRVNKEIELKMNDSSERVGDNRSAHTGLFSFEIHFCTILYTIFLFSCIQFDVITCFQFHQQQKGMQHTAN